MYRLEIGDSHPRIDLRGFNGRMAQHLLQMPDRRARPQHMGRTAVAKGVCRHGSVDVGNARVLMHDVPHGVRPHATAESIQEQMAVAIRT